MTVLITPKKLVCDQIPTTDQIIDLEKRIEEKNEEQAKAQQREVERLKKDLSDDRRRAGAGAAEE